MKQALLSSVSTPSLHSGADTGVDIVVVTRPGIEPAGRMASHSGPDGMVPLWDASLALSAALDSSNDWRLCLCPCGSGGLLWLRVC